MDGGIIGELVPCSGFVNHAENKNFNQAVTNVAPEFLERQVCDLQLLEECCEPRQHLNTKNNFLLRFPPVACGFLSALNAAQVGLKLSIVKKHNAPQKMGGKPQATQVLLMFYYTFVSGYAGHGSQSG